MVRILYFCLFLFLFISCGKDINKNIIVTDSSTYDSRFDEVLTSCIEKTDTNAVELVAKSETEIMESKLQNIGSVVGADGSRLQIITVKSNYGLRHSPHGNGRIYVVKDKKIIGYYHGLLYDFKACVNNGKLMVQASEGCPSTEIDFSKEIPASIFLLEDSSGGGNEYLFENE